MHLAGVESPMERDVHVGANASRMTRSMRRSVSLKWLATGQRRISRNGALMVLSTRAVYATMLLPASRRSVAGQGQDRRVQRPETREPSGQLYPQYDDAFVAFNFASSSSDILMSQVTAGVLQFEWAVGKGNFQQRRVVTTEPYPQACASPPCPLTSLAPPCPASLLPPTGVGLVQHGVSISVSASMPRHCSRAIRGLALSVELSYTSVLTRGGWKPST